MKHTSKKTTGCALGLLMFAVLPVFGQTNVASAFVGEWTNKDFATRNLTRIHVRLEGTNVMAHVWGRCHPAECDWGETAAIINGQMLSLNWDQKFATETQELTLLADGNLQVKGHRHFTDNSGRKDFDTKDVLAKGLIHDWSDSSPK